MRGILLVKRRDPFFRRQQPNVVFVQLSLGHTFSTVHISCPLSCAGFIPEELGALSQLSTLSLSDNELTGEGLGA